jgi:hypothetical protein
MVSGYEQSPDYGSPPPAGPREYARLIVVIAYMAAVGWLAWEFKQYMGWGH